jgi:formyltetrahydrofolate hydrolase
VLDLESNSSMVASQVKVPAQSFFINQRQSQEIKILMDENLALKAQIEKMKIFVPVSLLGNDLNEGIKNVKVWEIAAKVMNNDRVKPTGRVVTYLQHCLKDLLLRHQSLEKNILDLLQSKWEQHATLQSSLDAVNAKLESYQSEIEKAILSERQANDMLQQVSE